MIDQFDAIRPEVDKQIERFSQQDKLRARAAQLVSSDAIRNALDIRQDDSKLRDQYGRHLFGQSTLMGRRMVEAGSRFVTVLWDAPDGYSWDSHRSSEHLEKHLVPGFDQSNTE